MTPDITTHEYRVRQDALRELMRPSGVSGAVVFDPVSVAYLSGLFIRPTERMIALVIPLDADPILVVPQIAEAAAEQCAAVGQTRVYAEYPGRVHPMLSLVDVLQERRMTGGILGVDFEGYQPRWGYRGPDLMQIVHGTDLVSIRELIFELRAKKSAAELACLEESAKWAAKVIARTEDALRTQSAGNLDSFTLAASISRDAARAIVSEFGLGYPLRRFDSSLPVAVRIRAGEQTLTPLEPVVNTTLGADGVISIEAEADIWGYGTALNTTISLEPENRRFDMLLEATRELEQTATAGLRPGRRCREIATDVADRAKELGVFAYLPPRVGQCVGLERHEPPFLDIGDATIIESDMVFAIEIGLYLPGSFALTTTTPVCVTETGGRPLIS